MIGFKSMSKIIELEQMYVWKYSGEENYPGNNFSGTPESCQRLIAGLELYASKRVTGERFIMKLPPVSRVALRIVNSRSTDISSFRTIKIDCSQPVEFRERGEQLEMSLSQEDLQVFIEAMKAMRDGVGDFDALGAYFWPIRD